VLVTTSAVANLIREGKTHQIASMMQAGGALGMRTMDQHLAELVKSGAVSQQSAMEKAHDAEGLNRLLGRGGVPLPTGGIAGGAPGGGAGDPFSSWGDLGR
jgi:twitching motility protein PilT